MPAPLADGCMTQDHMHTDPLEDCLSVTVIKESFQTVIELCRMASSVTSPAFVLMKATNESVCVCGGTVVSTKMNVSHVMHPEGLVAFHRQPYHTTCRHCVRIFKLHVMDYPRIPFGNLYNSMLRCLAHVAGANMVA